MHIPLLTPTFTGMSKGQTATFADNYMTAAAISDVSWLEKALAYHTGLTPEHRSWLANQTLPNEKPLSVHAIEMEDHKLLRFLLREGALADGAMPCALMKRDSKAVKMLCDAKADTDAMIEGVPLLNIAATLWDADSCRHLLEAKAAVNAYRGSSSRTALFDCMGVFMQRVAPDEDDAPNPIIAHLDLKDGLRTIGVLMEYKADPHQKSDEYMSAFELAETFTEADARPMEAMQQWLCPDPAQAELHSFMARLRKGGPALS